MAPSIKYRAKRNTKSKMHKQQLIDMPLDVLIEIFLFLEPLDLLHLARTTKGLRAFLLSCRKSSALWKTAISNFIGFPPCPDHMSAPAYTHLAFVPVCHGCFCPCETVEWELRMRCCPNCFPKMTIPRYSILYDSTDKYLIDLDLPVARDHFTLDYDRGLDIVVSLLPVEPTYSFSLLDWKIVQRRKRLIKVESIKEFLAQQNDFWRSIRQDARSCRSWEYSRLREKAIRLSFVRRQRVQDINGRLRELGMIETVHYGYKFLQLPEVRKPEPLTPTEWIKIRPQLISWLRKADEESLPHRHKIIYESAILIVRQELPYVASLKVRPLMIDIFMLPAVRSVVESHMNSHSDCGILTKGLFRVLPLAIRKWSSNAVEELEQFARQELGLPPLSKPFCLPSVIFRCKVCHCRLRFDEALSHHHLYKAKRNKRKNTRKMSTYDELLMEYNTYPRNIQALRVDVTVSRRVENLIRRMGQNPSRITHRELCHSTVKVICGLCRPEVATRMVFEHAFEHCLRTHVWKKETEVWTRVSARG